MESGQIKFQGTILYGEKLDYFVIVVDLSNYQLTTLQCEVRSIMVNGV